MIARRLSGFLLAFCAFTSLPATAIQNDDPLLAESYDLSQRLGGPEQLYYLIELCRVNVLDASNPHPWQKTSEAASKLFRLASTEQNNVLHTVGQKNGITCLSYIDPEAALGNLSKIDFERPRPAIWVYEDQRYNAAQTTFKNYLASFGEVPPPRAAANITAKAKYLGQTGQYPYVAVADVINQLPSSFKNEKNTLLGDALSFYASETGFYNRDEEFLRLLQSLKNSSVDRTLFSHALATFVQRLKNDPIRVPGDYYAEIHINSDGKVFPFTDRNDAFLFQAFPLIQQFIPAKAAELRQEDPKLGQAADGMTYISGGFVQGNPTSEQAIQQHRQWLQESLIERIKNCRESNPRAAADLAQRLTDLSLRIVGFSVSIPSIAKTNVSMARSLYDKQVSDLGNLSDSANKLQAIVALAPVAYHLGYSKQYEHLSTQSLEMGIQYFNSDTRTTRIGRHEGFSELRELVTATASLPSDILKTKVLGLPDGWLKAYLMLYEVVGHTRAQSPPAPSKPCDD